MKQFKNNGKDFIAIEYDKFEELAKGILHEDIMAKKLIPVLYTNSYTEEDAALVVDTFNNGAFRDYLAKYPFSPDSSYGEFYLTAKESFQSKMESIGCPIVNKYGEEPDHMDYKHEKFKGEFTFKSESSLNAYAENYDQWKTEQSKIKCYLILEKT